MLRKMAPAGKSRLEKVIEIAAMSTDTYPSDAQKETGNYRKGRFRMNGLTIVIEVPKGSIRSGISSSGERWSVQIPVHYGYILKTVSEADGDHLDVYVGPHVSSGKVYAIDQVIDGVFDEHKFMIGFSDKFSAKAAYEASFNGAAPFGGMVELTWDEFKEWISIGNSSQPIVDQMLREFNGRIELLKSADGSVFLYGACMVPGKVDRSRFRDYYTEEEVRKACYGYMEKSQKAGFHHMGFIKSSDAHLVESYLLKSEEIINGMALPKGSWIVKFKLNHPDLVRMAKSGELAAFSIGGRTKKWRLENKDGTYSRWYGPNGEVD